MRDVLELAALYHDLLPAGWRVWLNTSGTQRWRAVPATAEATTITELPGQVAADSPAALREAVRGRYGWHATCVTCNVPARDCGHRERPAIVPAATPTP